jgi:hypothetical protein
MTIRDPEVLQALRDEPELLAIADAVAETQKPSRARRWLVPGSLVAVGAAAVAAALLVLFWPGGGGSSSILDRARAAIGTERVLHVVVEAPVGATYVNLETGRTTAPTYVTESWIDEQSKHVHLVVRVNRSIVGEILLPQDKDTGATVTPGGPVWAAFWDGFRKALASGSAKIDGSGSIYGHRVYWVTFPGAPDSTRTEFGIDHATYELVAYREHVSTTRTVDAHVLTLRTVPFDPREFTRLSTKPSPSSGSSSGSTGLSGPNVASAKPLLVAGDSIAGLRLRSVTGITAGSGKRTVHGVVLTYGRPASEASLTIQELPRPDDPSSWRQIPPGSIRIEAGTESSSNGGEHPLWTGDLVKDGVYVTIETGVSRSAVIAAARALHRPT